MQIWEGPFDNVFVFVKIYSRNILGIFLKNVSVSCCQSCERWRENEPAVSASQKGGQRNHLCRCFPLPQVIYSNSLFFGISS